jgi:hypothetical protein
LISSLPGLCEERVLQASRIMPSAYARTNGEILKKGFVADKLRERGDRRTRGTIKGLSRFVLASQRVLLFKKPAHIDDVTKLTIKCHRRQIPTSMDC